jgi:hypothetical protein
MSDLSIDDANERLWCFVDWLDSVGVYLPPKVRQALERMRFEFPDYVETDPSDDGVEI